jgi:hypothetical protein
MPLLQLIWTLCNHNWADYVITSLIAFLVCCFKSYGCCVCGIVCAVVFKNAHADHKILKLNLGFFGQSEIICTRVVRKIRFPRSCSREERCYAGSGDTGV